MSDYKKSYSGFIIMMLVFTAVMFVLPFISDIGENAITIILFNFLDIWMVLLTWIIYKTEKIYWYTGVSYEEAAKTDSANRKRYAFCHFKRFLYYAVIYAVYSVIAYLADISLTSNILFATVGIVAVAISTINIKLTEKAV